MQQIINFENGTGKKVKRANEKKIDIDFSFSLPCQFFPYTKNILSKFSLYDDDIFEKVSSVASQKV
jgi:hypothetical protein